MQRLHGGGHAARQRNLDEHERLVGQRRVEERVAPPVPFEPPAQVAPSLNLVDRLVLDQALEDHRRGVPVDSLKDQEPAVEPRPEQVNEVRVDAGPLGVRAERLQQLPPHLEEDGGAARGHVGAAEQFLARRLDGRLQTDEIGRRRVGAVAGRGPVHFGGVGTEVRRQPVEEEVASASSSSDWYADSA